MQYYYDTITKHAKQRDNYTCQRCFDTPKRLETHHWIPICHGGLHEFDNLVTLCHSCHVEVTKEYQDFYKSTNKESRPKSKIFRKINRQGHVLIYKPNHPSCNKDGFIPEHRFVVEQALGRYLTKDEDVHHINKIKKDNRYPENLQVLSRKDHAKIHAKNRIISEEAKRRSSLSHKGQVAWNKGIKASEGARQNMILAHLPFRGKPSPMKGRKHSDKSKQKMSIAQKGKKLSEETKHKMSLSNLGKKYSKESIQKSADKRRGKKRTEESKLKMSRAVKARWEDSEYREKVSSGLKGRVPWNKGLAPSKEEQKARKKEYDRKYRELNHDKIEKNKKEYYIKNRSRILVKTKTNKEIRKAKTLEAHAVTMDQFIFAEQTQQKKREVNDYSNAIT